MKFFIDGVGEVLVERSRRAGRMSISVRPERVRVAVPAGIALSKGKDFAFAKKEWIRRHLRRMESLARSQAGEAFNLPPMTDRETARKKIIVRLGELCGTAWAPLYPCFGPQPEDPLGELQHAGCHQPQYQSGEAP